MTTPTTSARPLRGLLESDPVVATAGVSLLADALRDQAVPVTETQWQPPMAGTETDLARVMGDPRRAAANALAFERMTTAEAVLVDVVPASEALGLEPDSPTLYLERLRMVDGEPYLLEQVHLPAERFPGLLASDLEHGSLYEILVTRYGTPIVRARETIEPVLLRGREAKLLAQRSGSPALLVEGLAYAADGSVVEFGRSYVRGDRSRYLIDRVVVRSGLDDRVRNVIPRSRTVVAAR